MSFAEWIVVIVVAIIVFGPKKLPEMARKAGRFMGVLRKASEEFKQQLMAMDQAVQEEVGAALPDPDSLEPDEEITDTAGTTDLLPETEEPPMPPEFPIYESQDQTELYTEEPTDENADESDSSASSETKQNA